MAATVEVVIEARDSFSSVLGDFGSIITGIQSAIGLVGDAFNAAVGAITPFIESASDSEQAITRLEGVLSATGGAVGLTSRQLQDLASTMQSVTVFSDEEIMSAEALMLTFRNVSGDVFPRAIEAAADMASIFGSLEASTMQLGKALQDPVSMMGALSRAGVTFTEEQKEMIKGFVELGDVASAQNIILTEVENQVGNLAEAMGGTFAGQLAIAKNKLDEFRETIGNAVLPILTNLLSKLSEFASRPEVVKFFDDIAKSVSGFLTSLNLEGNLTNLLDSIATAMRTGDWSPVWDAIRTAFSEGWSTIWGTVSPIIDDLFARLFAWMEGRVNEWIDNGGADRIGNNIADAINATFATPQFQSKAMAAFNALMDTLIRAIELIDWGEVGRAVATSIGESLDRSLNVTINIDTLNAMARDIIQGLINGFTGNYPMLIANIASWISNFISFIKQALGISSPSTVFYDIGRNIVQGLINGFLGMVGTLTDAIGSIVAAILSPFAPILDLLGIGGGSGNVGLNPLDPGSIGGRAPVTGDDRTGSILTGGLGGVTNIFNGPVYFGDMSSIGYDCPSPHPLMTASSQSLLATVSIG